MRPVPPRLEIFIHLAVKVGAPVSLGNLPSGERKCIPILGGEVCGAITGKIIPGGADHIVIRADGCIEIDARYCLQTDSGATIYVRDQGYRHGRPEIMQSLARAEAVNPTEYYFRTCMRLETADPVLSAINKMLFLGSACRTPEQVLIDLYKVH